MLETVFCRGERCEEWPPNMRPRCEIWDIPRARRVRHPVFDIFLEAKALGKLLQNMRENRQAATIDLPCPSYSHRAEELLTAADRVLLGEYFTKLEHACANIGTPVSKITVDFVPDPEENVRSIVVTSYYDVDADTALLYWDAIGREFDLWASGPEEDTAEEVLDLVSTNLRWRE